MDFGALSDETLIMELLDIQEQTRKILAILEEDDDEEEDPEDDA